MNCRDALRFWLTTLISLYLSLEKVSPDFGLRPPAPVEGVADSLIDTRAISASATHTHTPLLQLSNKEALPQYHPDLLARQRRAHQTHCSLRYAMMAPGPWGFKFESEVLHGALFPGAHNNGSTNKNENRGPVIGGKSR